MQIIKSPYNKETFTESDVCSDLSKNLRNYPELKTNLEVSCKYGRVDILTHPFIIEVKQFNLYKHGIGQLKAYNKVFTYKKSLLYLFNPSGVRLKTKTKNKIFEFCRSENIWLFEHLFNDPKAFIRFLDKYKFIKAKKDHLIIPSKSYRKKEICRVRNKEGKLIKIL